MTMMCLVARSCFGSVNSCVAITQGRVEVHHVARLHAVDLPQHRRPVGADVLERNVPAVVEVVIDHAAHVGRAELRDRQLGDLLLQDVAVSASEACMMSTSPPLPATLIDLMSQSTGRAFSTGVFC